MISNLESITFPPSALRRDPSLVTKANVAARLARKQRDRLSAQNNHQAAIAAGRTADAYQTLSDQARARVSLNLHLNF